MKRALNHQAMTASGTDMHPKPTQAARHADQADAHTSEAGPRRAHRHRFFIKGYSSVLLKDSVKAALTQFRRDSGLGDSHIERGLITAALRYMLAQPELHGAWMQQLAIEVQDDILQQARQPKRDRDDAG